MISIGFFGECMVEIFGNNQSFSGDTYNTAVYLARLARNSEIDVSYISAIGTDEISAKMLDAWRNEGINTSQVIQLKDKTVGQYTISVDNQGERCFDYERDNSAAKDYFRAEVTPFEQALQQRQLDYVYLSGISLAILCHKHRIRLLAVLKKFKQAGGKIVFDNNFRPALWRDDCPEDYYRQVMALSSLVMLTDDDEYAIYGESQVGQIFDRCVCLILTKW